MFETPVISSGLLESKCNLLPDFRYSDISLEVFLFLLFFFLFWEDCLCLDTGQYYRYFLSQIHEAFPAQIPKISVKTFPCLFWSPAITLEPICESDSFPLEYPVSAYLLKLTLVE